MNAENQFPNFYSLRDEIFEVIRERILKGEYCIGEKIKESQIASELKVSRTPVREAFKMLEDEGLIDYIPNRGCFAKGFTSQDIDDIYNIRKSLETLALEWAISKISHDELNRMDDIMAEMKHAIASKDEESAEQAIEEFHASIYNAAASRFMTQVLRSYKGYLEQSSMFLLGDRDHLEEVYTEHMDILDAMHEKDADKGKEALIRHLDESKKRASASYIS